MTSSALLGTVSAMVAALMVIFQVVSSPQTPNQKQQQAASACLSPRRFLSLPGWVWVQTPGLHLPKSKLFRCAGIMLQVLYHQQQPSVFISGSMDGLINVADFSEGLDEDDSFKVGQRPPCHPMALLLCYWFTREAGNFGRVVAPKVGAWGLSQEGYAQGSLFSMPL